jgi:hypothetical protein
MDVSTKLFTSQNPIRGKEYVLISTEIPIMNQEM